jgi:ferredoxin--NADP+ reductase
MPAEWLPTQVIDRRTWTPGLVTLRFDADLGDFTPGQFAQIALTEEERPLKRAYSLSSPPGAPPEVFVIAVDGGALSPSLTDLQVGDRAFITAEPKGHFTLAEVPTDRTPWLIATGTGLAPYIAMLRHAPTLAAYPGFVVVHGARTRDELAYGDELRALEQSTGGRVRYVPLTSRQDLDHAPKCRITEALVDSRLEQLAGRPLDTSAHVLLCGNPAMIAEMQTLLAERGMKRHTKREPGHITTERYW